MYSTNKKSYNSNLVDIVLQRGEQLKDKMTQSILNNSINRKQSEMMMDNTKLKAYLRGDPMTKEEEISALETIKSLPVKQLCQITDETFKSSAKYNNYCDCIICENYDKKNLSVSDNNEITLKIQEKYQSEVYKYLDYIDSLKISVHNILFNESGNKKVYSNLDKNKSVGVSEIYFVQYAVPDVLIKNTPKIRPKINTGLDFNNVVKLCSRRLYNESISFKQNTIHDIASLRNINLSDVEVRFQIYCRILKQKPTLLGYAKFNFSSFKVARNFTCNRELKIKLNEKTPLNLGLLKVTIQLGCGRLYFGKEFIDAVNDNKENSVAFGSEDVSYYASQEIKKLSPKKLPIIKSTPKIIEIKESDKQILFGLIYISEAQYLRQFNSYLSCRIFCENDASFSRLIHNNSNPIFNFYQQVPLIYEDELLARLRDNFVVVEFFAKSSSGDFVIGLTKLPLHQFYIAYRNPVVVKYLTQKKLPVISSDWWEPITSPVNDEVVGQVQILLALGTEEQISNLELDRGFRKNSVKAKISPATIAPPKKSLIEKNRISENLIKSIKKSDVGTQSDLVMENKEEQQANLGPSTPEMLEKLLKQFTLKNNSVENSTNTEQNNESNIKVAENVENVSKAQSVSTRKILDTIQQTVTYERRTFKASIVVKSALHLPSRKKCKSKKSKTRAANKSEDNTLPSTYVSYETGPNEVNVTQVVMRSTSPKWEHPNIVDLPTDLLFNQVPLIYEDELLAKLRDNFGVVEFFAKSSSGDFVIGLTKLPLHQFYIAYTNPVVVKYLTQKKNEKRLIFKVWRKSNNTTIQRNFQTDFVLGLVVVDLTVLAAGLPTVEGWFNIVDFSNKCNGQLNIHVTPLEHVTKLRQQYRPASNSSQQFCPPPNFPQQSRPISNLPQSSFPVVSKLPQQFPPASNLPQTSKVNENLDDSNELLSRALKRKFTELDEITQRLRLRLSTVTNDESDASNDEAADEFERDINTLCVEDDFDMVDFEKESSNKIMKRDEVAAKENLVIPALSLGSSNSQLTDENSVIDISGRKHVDSLLEQLSLVSGDNRHVSGCSTRSNIDTEAILNHLDHTSRPNINQHSSFDRFLIEQLKIRTEANYDFRDSPEGEGDPDG